MHRSQEAMHVKHGAYDTVLPDGVKKDWPTKLDEAEVYKHVRASLPLADIVTQNPTSSPFLTPFNERRAEVRTAPLGSGPAEMLTFMEYMPGFISYEGLTIIHNITFNHYFPPAWQMAVKAPRRTD
ncbi:hypothetical protein JCM5296_000008 [Sporobolomyces johnsonii]